MSKPFNMRLSWESGMTVVEILVAMLISSIVFTGMMITYIQGVEYTRDNSSTLVLYNEGRVALEKMGLFIREAHRARISSYGGASNARLRLEYPDEGLDGGEAEFIFSRASKEIKWNNRRGQTRQLNMTLLPTQDIDIGPDEDPYLMVKDCRFMPLDHIGAPSPYLEGYWLIKIELVLEDDRGDTIYLSSVHSKRNKR